MLTSAQIKPKSLELKWNSFFLQDGSDVYMHASTYAPSTVLVLKDFTNFMTDAESVRLVGGNLGRQMR